MIDQDILTYVAYHNNKIVGHQDAKSPFWPPELAQNSRNQQKRTIDIWRVIKTTYEQTFKSD